MKALQSFRMHACAGTETLCGCLQACESPLLVAVAAGSLALPTLLKLATLMAGQNQDFLTCNQLPVVSSLLHCCLASHRPASYGCREAFC